MKPGRKDDLMWRQPQQLNIYRMAQPIPTRKGPLPRVRKVILASSSAYLMSVWHSVVTWQYTPPPHKRWCRNLIVFSCWPLGSPINTSTAIMFFFLLLLLLFAVIYIENFRVFFKIPNHEKPTEWWYERKIITPTMTNTKKTRTLTTHRRALRWIRLSGPSTPRWSACWCSSASRGLWPICPGQTETRWTSPQPAPNDSNLSACTRTNASDTEEAKSSPSACWRTPPTISPSETEYLDDSTLSAEAWPRRVAVARVGAVRVAVAVAVAGAGEAVATAAAAAAAAATAKETGTIWATARSCWRSTPVWTASPWAR